MREETTRSDWSDGPGEALKFAQVLREYHHNALWEEEKHFTWLHSVIVAAQAAILSKPVSELPHRGEIVLALCVVGLLFAVVAYRVVQREGGFFVSAHNLYVDKFNPLFPGNNLSKSDIDGTSNLVFMPFRVLWGVASIREYFQFVFVVFGAIYAVLLVAVVNRWL